MRRAVPLLLGGSLIGLVALTIARSKPGHEAPLVVIQDEGKADAAADAAPSSDASGPVVDASVVAVASDAGDGAPPPAPPRVLDRPLRVTTLGNVLAAPATVFKEVTDGARDLRRIVINRGALALEGPIHPTQKPIALYKWLLQNYA